VAADLAWVQVVSEPWPGLSPARNAGLPHLTGDVVVLDDDVVVTPGWLEELLSPCCDPAVGAVTGNVLPANLELLDPQVFQDCSGLGRGPHRHTDDRAWLDASRAHVADRCHGERRRAPRRAGRARPLRRGPGRPSGVVLHHHRADRPALLRQLRACSTGHVAHHRQVAARHGDLRGPGRIALRLPQHHTRRFAGATLGTDDYLLDVLTTEVAGVLAGPGAWWRSRRALREAGRPVPD